MDKRRTKADFEDIKRRIGKKHACLKALALLAAVKGILIKPNLTGIPL